MKNIIQARLDAATKKALAILKRRLGLNDSEIIRKGIQLLLSITPTLREKRMIGVGCIESGIKDLGSDKKYLQGFGK